MALKALMLRKKINDATKALEELRAKDAEFTTREADLEKSIDEASTDEERSAVEEEITNFETEKAAHEENKAGLERKISDLEADLAEEEKKQDTEAPAQEERKEAMPEIMTRENTAFSVRVREAVKEEAVKNYLAEVRASIKEHRALTNVGLIIPEVMLGLLKENIENYSKLLKYVTVRRISGTGRERIMGAFPEAVWTECCANLNELSLGFNDVEVDCYKVGGFFKVCNATLEDNDVDLASNLLAALGQAIGYALDKAILYGRNTSGNSKMPLGVVSRLVQTSAPSDYPATARPWADLHTSNVLTIANTVTGVTLFQTILLDSGVISDKYSKDEVTWLMNKTTKNYLTAQAMGVNASGAIVSGFEGTMPVIGGKVEVLDFIPNYVIITGHFDDYLLSERAGNKFAQSEHAFFLQDQTAFKGTARYDGQPMIAEAFAAIGVNGTSPSASMTFAADNANIPDAVVLNKSATSIAAGSNETLKATVLAAGIPVNATITWASSAESKATVANGKVTGVASGSAVITASAGSAVAVCNVTVTS